MVVSLAGMKEPLMASIKPYWTLHSHHYCIILVLDGSVWSCNLHVFWSRCASCVVRLYRWLQQPCLTFSKVSHLCWRNSNQTRYFSFLQNCLLIIFTKEYHLFTVSYKNQGRLIYTQTNSTTRRPQWNNKLHEMSLFKWSIVTHILQNMKGSGDFKTLTTSTNIDINIIAQDEEP